VKVEKVLIGQLPFPIRNFSFVQRERSDFEKTASTLLEAVKRSGEMIEGNPVLYRI